MTYLAAVLAAAFAFLAGLYLGRKAHPESEEYGVQHAARAVVAEWRRGPVGYVSPEHERRMELRVEELVAALERREEYGVQGVDPYVVGLWRERS